MEYTIKGETLPVVICELNQGENLVSEAGGMAWMSEGVKMDTNMKGGLFKGLGRAFTGESVFLNTFECQAPNGLVSFTSSFPGRIMARELQEGEAIICQKGAFLAGTNKIEVTIDFRKKIGAGFFGGEGFILQRISGPGVCFMEFDGHIEEYDLQAGQKMVVDTGHVGMFETTVSYDIQMVKGVKNIVFGGEGLFLTTLTGPGKVYLQTMPINNLAGRLSAFLPTGN